jgi:UDP-N-acetylglucosamine 2-epimerase (non-hydrolysing)
MSEKAAVVGLAFGTRPEAVKIAPVARALDASGIAKILFSTGQHRALLDQTLAFFGLRPDHDLGLMIEDQPLPELLSRVISGMAQLLRENPVDLLLVQGGTSTALGAATAAYLAGIPVGHVEAGLRSFDKSQPFPEEAYRSLIARLAGWHFCATSVARDNLFKEGVEGKRLFITGNTAVDATRWAREQMSARPWLGTPLPLPHTPERFALVTCHRRESFGKGIEGLIGALRTLTESRADLHFVWPLHPNPNVRSAAAALSGHPQIHVVDPVDYPTMLRLLETCHFILTDSGGLQDEAPEFAKPTLVLRSVTDRPEIVDMGAALLVGTDPRRIIAAANRLCDDKTYYERMAGVSNPFGDGQAGLRIVRMLVRTHFSPPP